MGNFAARIVACARAGSSKVSIGLTGGGDDMDGIVSVFGSQVNHSLGSTTSDKKAATAFAGAAIGTASESRSKAY